MRFHIIKAIYQRELLDLVRDRRTMISMVVVPLFVFPLLMVLGVRVVSMMEEKSQRESKSMSVAVKVTTLGIVEALRNAGLPVAEKTDPRAAIDKKECSAGIEEVAGTAGSPELQVYVDSSSPTSSTAGDKIRVALTDLKEERVRQSLRTSGIPESVLSPFTIKKVNVAPARKMAGMVWGSMLGYLLLLLMFSGGMYPIIDMTAGEKERKTLEAFLATPAGRNEIVLGKTLAATTCIFITAMLTLGSIVFAVRSNRIASKSEEIRAMFRTIPLDGHTLLLIVLTLIPLCVFAASVMMAIAMFARSYKEGQSYLTPLVLLVVFPALLGGMPGLELTPALCLIPIFNASQIIRSILLGDVSTTAFTVTLAANIAYAAIAVVIARRRFEDESVLFRS